MSVFDKHLASATFERVILALETTEERLSFCRKFIQLHNPPPSIKTEKNNDDEWYIPAGIIRRNIIESSFISVCGAVSQSNINNFLQERVVTEHKLKMEVANIIGLELLKSGHIKISTDFDNMKNELHCRGEVKVTK